MTNPANGISTITLRKRTVTPMVRPKPGSTLNFFPGMMMESNAAIAVSGSAEDNERRRANQFNRSFAFSAFALLNLVKGPAVAKMRCLRLFPAAENFINREQRQLWKFVA